MGALYSLELPPNDPIATEYHALSKACLVKGNFLVNNTISGVQTLVSFDSLSSQADTAAHHGPLPLVRWGLWMKLMTGKQRRAGMEIRHGRSGVWQCASPKPWGCIAMESHGACHQKSSKKGGECRRTRGMATGIVVAQNLTVDMCSGNRMPPTFSRRTTSVDRERDIRLCTNRQLLNLSGLCRHQAPQGEELRGCRRPRILHPQMGACGALWTVRLAPSIATDIQSVRSQHEDPQAARLGRP